MRFQILTYTVDISNNGFIEYSDVSNIVFMHWPHVTTFDGKVDSYRMYSVGSPVCKLAVF